ncbi:hypothetical protein RCL_jg22945.t1 [Rhizophagus clarus]|uniref:Uncharacterized protein n=1 Tax=Rhizophagus clarus TaxID=94130 RepID=A0A8H3QKL4_9GLOM|nr:hypothetical protein RCL_jg22945.t1 [Rhizophagus clarus]
MAALSEDPPLMNAIRARFQSFFLRKCLSQQIEVAYNSFFRFFENCLMVSYLEDGVPLLAIIVFLVLVAIRFLVGFHYIVNKLLTKKKKNWTDNDQYDYFEIILGLENMIDLENIFFYRNDFSGKFEI